MKTANNLNPKISQLARLAFYLLIPCLLLVNLNAQDAYFDLEDEKESSELEYRHALNICPLAVAFGIYAVNYEYLFAPKQGIVIRYEFESIPKSYTDANIESSGMAFVLNYRWHLKKDLNSAYAGSFVRYRVYKGNGILESQDFDFNRKDITLGLNYGKRWIFKNGFNINLTFGYGYSFDNREADPSSDSIEAKIDEFEKEYDFMGAFLGEFSIGYAF